MVCITPLKGQWGNLGENIAEYCLMPDLIVAVLQDWSTTGGGGGIVDLKRQLCGHAVIDCGKCLSY